MVLTSPAFEDGRDIPIEYTQSNPEAAEGEGTSPALTWTNVPEGTQSFVIHFRDLDVARERGTEDQVHWLVWNIPAETTSLPEGVQRGAQLEDGSYQISATGPVYRGPGAGASGPKHHYMFEVYALDTMLDVTPSEEPFEREHAFETRRQVFAAMQGHVLGKAVYGGLFKRPE